MRLVMLVSHHEDGATRMAHDLLGDRAEEQPLDAGAAVRREDDDVRVDLGGLADDLFGGIAREVVDDELRRGRDRKGNNAEFGG